MSAFLAQAKIILDQVDLDTDEVRQAKDILNSMTKTSGASDLINDPKFQNVVNLLTPFVVNYKVNQVIKLLKEMEQEQGRSKTDRKNPDTGFKKYL